MPIAHLIGCQGIQVFLHKPFLRFKFDYYQDMIYFSFVRIKVFFCFTTIWVVEFCVLLQSEYDFLLLFQFLIFVFFHTLRFGVLYQLKLSLLIFECLSFVSCWFFVLLQFFCFSSNLFLYNLSISVLSQFNLPFFLAHLKFSSFVTI